MQEGRLLFCVLLVGTGLTAAPLAAQETPTQALCRTAACGVLVDWGAGGPPAGIDRRYGTIGDFEALVFRGLLAAGYRFTQTPDEGAFAVRLRPRTAAALCDRVSGLNPDMSCSTIGEVRTDFLNADGAGDLPGNLRIRNRCGNGEMMDILKFSTHVVEMLDYTLALDKDRKRPTAKC